MDIANCPKCGKLYTKNIMNMCQSCVKDIEEQFEKCKSFLRNNRKCTLEELSEGTGVSTRVITGFIREGRIAIGDFPNMYYECEMCGAGIRDSRLCKSCKEKLAKELQNLQEDELKRAVRNNHSQVSYLKDK